MLQKSIGVHVIVPLTAIFIVIVIGSFYLSSISNTDTETTAATATFAELIDGPIQPIPFAVTLDQRRVTLGRDLFTDPRLSGSGTISCSTCHDLVNGGIDGLPVSVGIDERTGFVNAPTVYNSAYNFRQFWDGRAESLEDQIDGPVNNDFEMGSDWDTVIATLSQHAPYLEAFGTIYPDGITVDNIKDAIATFQRSLVTPNSRFDQYLRGDESAITEAERRGYALFHSYGCISCHQGINVGGNLFQRFGIMRDYFADRGHITPADLGRYNVTGREEDRHVFKVPGLRNIALTAPYFHDASAATLEDAVQTMGFYQLGLSLDDEDVALLVAFLETLTGEHPELSVQFEG
ncbi:MAG: cytochrome-c peroxidase [Chloroflexi bacterium]|nr:cytochrome-c peroxidase [Chloroflexota bacterium]